jgi:hypothetical protein
MQTATTSRLHWATQLNDGEIQDVNDDNQIKIDRPVL